MGKFVVKKRISLEFLGEDYKEGYLTVSAMTMAEYEKVQDKIAGLEDNNKEATKFVRDAIEDRFIEGKFPVDGELQDIKKEDLLDLPAEVFVQAFQELQGKLLPKV